MYASPRRRPVPVGRNGCDKRIQVRLAGGSLALLGTFRLARYRKAPNAISALTPAGMSLVLPAAIFLNRDSSLEWVRELPVVRAAITTRPMVKAAMSGLEV